MSFSFFLSLSLPTLFLLSLSRSLSPFFFPPPQKKKNKKNNPHRPVDVLHQVRQPRQRPQQPGPRRRRPHREQRALAKGDRVAQPAEPERHVVLELAEARRRRVHQPEQEQRDGRELLGGRGGERLGRERRRGVAVAEQARADGGGELLLVGLVRERARVLPEEGGGGGGGVCRQGGGGGRRFGGGSVGGGGFEGGREEGGGKG